MLGLMKRVNLVKYAMTPNRIINKTSDFEYHIAKQLGYMAQKKEVTI